MRKLRQRRAGRDPARKPAPPVTVTVLTHLWRDLLRLDPSRYNGARFGAEVYLSEQRIDNALVLADALSEQGYPALARRLSAWANQLIWYNHVKANKKPLLHVRYPSWEKWKSIAREVELVLAELQSGRPEIHWWTTRYTTQGALTTHPVILVRTDSAGWAYVRPLVGRSKGREIVVADREVTSYRPKSAWLAAGARRYIDP